MGDWHPASLAPKGVDDIGANIRQANIVATRNTHKTAGIKQKRERKRSLSRGRLDVSGDFFEMIDYKSYRLYEQGDGPTRRFVKLVTRVEGERMVRGNMAQAGLDHDGETLCFRLTEASVAATVRKAIPAGYQDNDMPAEISSAAFSQPEMMAIAGTKFKHGRSRTARMSEEQRQARVKRIYDDGLVRNGATVRGVKVKPEDMVERATNKFRGFALYPMLMDRVRVVAAI